MVLLVANTGNGISRNKRKFRPDPPVEDPDKLFSMPNNYSPTNEFPSQKTETTQTHENLIQYKTCHSDSLGLDLGLSARVGSSDLSSRQLKYENDVAYEFGDWTGLTETELKELVLNNLAITLKNAIKKVIACGYSEEVVFKAVLRPGVYYGPKDIMSNIIHNTLSFIRNENENDLSKEYYFENFEQLENYILFELVCIIREVMPSYSTGDALWCLLVCDMNVSNACKLDDNALRPPQFENNTETHNPEFRFSASSKPEVLKPKKSLVGPISLADSGIKSVCTRKISGIRQKSFHAERTYRTYRSKSSSRSGKHSSFSFGGFVLDKKSRPLSQSVSVNFKNSPLKITKTVVTDKQLSPKGSTEMASGQGTQFCEGTQNHRTNSVKKDVMLKRLLPRERILRDQLEKWDEWANRKVMQVAKRLGKDKAELKALREEREEGERVRREKQTLEENTAKKLAKMESDFFKLGREMEWASGAMKRLERENGSLRREMEIEKERGEEAAEELRERVRSEKENAAKVGKLEKERGLFRDELVAEKRKAGELDREVELAKERRDREEARWKQEEKAKENLLKEANSIKAEREELEASARAHEETIKSNAQKTLKDYKDSIQKLEQEISLLRLKNDSSKITALRQGSENPGPNKTHNRDIKRERECVMCLSEEMSVVFLPCAHQILCSKCNELHEKQGMKDCPSCRGPIQRRISVRYAKSCMRSKVEERLPPVKISNTAA